MINKKLFSNNDSQLIILAGIIICVLIITSSAATIGLLNRRSSQSETTFLKQEYGKVRDKFGEYLKGLLTGKMDNVTFIRSCINYTGELFSYAQARHNNFFNAEFVEVTKTGEDSTGLIVQLTLYNQINYINEKVTYYIM